MADIQPGHIFTPGEIVTDISLTDLVGSALILPESISTKPLKDPASLSDEIAINDGGVIKKLTMVQLKAIIASAIGSDGLADEARLPAGAVVDFAGAVEPAGWVFCFGQSYLRIGTYARLFAAIGTIHGLGSSVDGTTFAVPDYRGRVGAGKDNMGGTNASRLSDSGLVGHGVVGTTLGDTGGTQSHTITPAELAAHQHTFSDYYERASIIGGGGAIESGNDITVTSNGSFVVNGTNATGSNVRHNNVQPTIVMNKIIRYM